MYCIVNVDGSRMEIAVTCQLEHSLRGHCFEMGLNWASTPAIYSTSSSCSPDIWQCREALSGCCLLWSLVGSLRFLVRCPLPKPVSNFSLNVSVSRMSFHIPLSAGSILMYHPKQALFVLFFFDHLRWTTFRFYTHSPLPWCHPS